MARASVHRHHDVSRSARVAVPAVTVGGLVIVAACAGVLAWSMQHASYDVWAALLVAPVLIVVTIPLARRAARLDSDPRLVWLMMAALFLKLLGSMARYFVAFEVYDASADAAIYLREGRMFAERFRAGIFTFEPVTGGSDGTHFIRRFTGAVMALIGPTSFGTFLVFAWLSFIGLYLFYRAFRIAVPHGDGRRYALLIFFLPSLLYWPSSVGKEAWMLLTLGIAANGAARVLAQARGGYAILALGLFSAALVRPHMSALVAAALVAGFLLRRSRTPSLFGPITKVVGGVVVTVILVLSMQAAEERFGVEGEGLTGVNNAIDHATEQTSKGGSEFEASRPDSLTDLPWAVFTVMFRPLPHEAHNLQAGLTSIEGLALLVLVLASWRRLRRVLIESWRTAYVAFAVAYSGLFMVAFSSFGNFGILARQRAQLFPFVLVLLALPKVAPDVADDEPAIGPTGAVP